MEVRIGDDVCFLCDHPEVGDEVWSTSCAEDQDGMCTCAITDMSPGIQLCFSNFHPDCSGTYSCSAFIAEPGCSAEQFKCSADIVVATG